MRKIFLVGLALVSLGFDLSQASIRPEEIQESGIPVDGIPALTNPEFISAPDADDFLESEDLVIGIVQGRTVRAYPLRILNWHEVVNDSIEGEPVVITYCPWAGSIRVFRAQIQGRPYQFGVSGKHYKNNHLLYDRATKSLWSPMRAEAVSGPMKGTVLEPIPVGVAPWRKWRNQYPTTQVLSMNTGFLRDYYRDPYGHYAGSEKLMFPAGEIRRELSPKARVIGIRIKGVAKAYPWEFLKKKAAPRLKDQIGDQKIMIEYLPELGDVRVRDAAGNLLEPIRAYWFAWQAFYPETEIDA